MLPSNKVYFSLEYKLESLSLRSMGVVKFRDCVFHLLISFASIPTSYLYDILKIF